MKKIWWGGLALVLAGSLSGYFMMPQKSPYHLDYKHVALNILLEYSEYLAKPQYVGEIYLAQDMAKEMAKYGVTAKVYTLEDTYSNLGFNEGYELYLRPLPELRFPRYHDVFDKDRIAVLFETFPYSLDEVKNADIIFTGSLKKNKEYRKLGLNSYFLPQFTRFDKFYPAPKDEFKRKILFVGNQWPGLPTRPTILLAKKTGLEIDIFGGNHDDELSGEYAHLWKGKQIAGDDLKYYYSSADIVLNDTRADMIEAGFISNRIFDVTACKGFLISDYIPEIEEIYGDAIPMYKNEDEFKRLIEYYLAHPEERREKAERAYKITKERFGADKIIPQMLQYMEAYRRQQGFKGAEN